MAGEIRNANPVIVEPAASSIVGTTPGLLTPSLNTSSSSTSFESSRPQSRGSSVTSPSESSSPVTRPVERYGITNIRPPTSPDLELLPQNGILLPNEQRWNERSVPTTVPVERAESTSHSHGVSFSWYSLCAPIFSRRRWLEHALAVFTLVASLVGLLWIGVRTYKLAVISAENSTLDGCTDLIQAGITTFENSTPLCKIAMNNGPLSSPYHLDKRKLKFSLALAARWMKGPAKQTCVFPYIGCQSQEGHTTYQSVSAPAFCIGMSLALGGFILAFTSARRKARSTEVITSPVRSNIQMTHHEDSGPKTVAGQCIIDVHNPEEHEDLGQLRKRIRASQDQDSLMTEPAPIQPANSSSTTLVSGYSKPKVSLQNHSSGEKHMNLVELQMNGNTKAFFKPETGEFFHLKHWTRQHIDDSASSSNSDNPITIEGEGFAKTGPIASALAKGREFKDKFIVGMMMNGLPTGKPQTI